jgi:hypothetical protein
VPRFFPDIFTLLVGLNNADMEIELDPPLFLQHLTTPYVLSILSLSRKLYICGEPLILPSSDPPFRLSSYQNNNVFLAFHHPASDGDN